MKLSKDEISEKHFGRNVFLRTEVLTKDGVELETPFVSWENHDAVLVAIERSSDRPYIIKIGQGTLIAVDRETIMLME